MKLFKKTLKKDVILIKKFLEIKEINFILNSIDINNFQIARQYNKGRVNKENFVNDFEIRKLIINKIEELHFKFRFEKILISDTLEFYLYEVGNYILPHRDSKIQIEDYYLSNYTAIIYLNENFIGGETYFNNLNKTIIPTIGSLLLFRQEQLHEAKEIIEGNKIIYRSNWYIKL